MGILRRYKERKSCFAWLGCQPSCCSCLSFLYIISNQLPTPSISLHFCCTGLSMSCRSSLKGRTEPLSYSKPQNYSVSSLNLSSKQHSKRHRTCLTSAVVCCSEILLHLQLRDCFLHKSCSSFYRFLTGDRTERLGTSADCI